MKQALTLFNSKSYAADPESGLWPAIGPSRYLTTGGITNMLLFNNSPTWKTLNGLQDYFNVFHTNPVVYAAIMIKAREYANMNIQVRKRKNGGDDPVMPLNSKVPLVKKLYSLFDSPNPLQSRGEFIMQRKIMYEVGANAFVYNNFASGNDVMNLLHMWNVWPQYMQYIKGGAYFDAMTIRDIIKSWKFKAGAYEKSWGPEEILFTSKPNTELNDDVIFGRSALASLYQPISNIDMSYESRNVMMKNRGMRLVFSSNQGDGTGKIPLHDEQVIDLEQRWGKYGMLRGQDQAFFSPYPINVTPIDQNVEKLGLFKEIANDALIICHAIGVPSVLMQMFLEGATYENQEASVRRLYQGTLIPEAEEDLNAFNKFFGLNETDYYLWPDFSHIPCLQESEAEKETTKKSKSDRMMAELAARLISPAEYRTLMGYGPRAEVTDEIKEPEPAVDETTTDQTEEEDTNNEEEDDAA